MTDVQQLAETTLGRAERFSIKAELKRVAEVVDETENVSMLAVGKWSGAGNSLILLTDRRLIAVNETGSMFSKKLRSQDVRLDRVTSVQAEDGRVHGKLTLATTGGDVEIESILPTGRAAEMANAIRNR